MEHYIRFVISMAFGLMGIGVVLKIVIDRLLSDWDAVADFKTAVRTIRTKRSLPGLGSHEDRLMQIEKQKPAELTTRRIDQRREQLRDLAKVEKQLSSVLPADTTVKSPAKETVSAASPATGEWSADWTR